MHEEESKVYFDGSHYIAIPKIEQTQKKRKNFYTNNYVKQEEKIKEIYKKNKEKPKNEKLKCAIEEINKEIQNEEKSKEIVDRVLAKETRNMIVRRVRMFRKANLQKWNYFCTFTYDSNKLTDFEFRQKLLNTLRHFSNRKGWRYIGVFELSPQKRRLHFHGLFYIPIMVGEIIPKRDYSTKNHKMQTTYQNTFFLEKYGRNDFNPINSQIELTISLRYLVKYINKTGEKIIYSKHLGTYFRAIILKEDVICPIGQEDRKQLLFDDFTCIDPDTGEYYGKVSPEIIEKMPKAY